MHTLKYVTSVGVVPTAPISLVCRTTRKPSLVHAARGVSVLKGL
jgi:hypothetical protein